jgi:hypothetical protein
MSDAVSGDSVPDLELSETQRAAIAKLAKDENVVKPPLKLARGAHLVNDDIERAAAADDPEVFWAERSELIDWIEPFHTVRKFDPPHHEWFLGGKAERHRQLHRPPRALRPAQQGGAHLGRRGRRGGYLHLQPSLS